MTFSTFVAAFQLLSLALILLYVAQLIDSFLWLVMLHAAAFLVFHVLGALTYGLDSFVKHHDTKKATAGAGRGAGGSKAPSGGTPKIPRARDLKIAKNPPAARSKKATALPAAAPITVCVYKYTDAASRFLNGFLPTTLYLLAVSHLCRPSVTWNILHAFGDFLARAHVQNAAIPGNLRELREQMHVVLTVTPRDDPDNMFDRNVVAFYVEAATPADLQAFLQLWDAYLTDRRTHQPADEQFADAFHVDYFQNANVAIGLANDAFDTPSTVHNPQETLPIAFTSAGPPWGNRHVLASFEAENENDVAILVHGNIFSFRNSFAAAGIPGQYNDENPDTANRDYFRMLPTVDARTPQAPTETRDMLATLLNDTLVSFSILGAPAADTPGHAFLALLRAAPQFFFNR